MRLLRDGRLVLAATDLSNFLTCRHLTGLSLAAAEGAIETPTSEIDLATERLRLRGQEHERAYVEHLRAQGLHVAEIPGEGPTTQRVAATIDALRSGVDVVYQGAFAGPGWIGYADILRRVDGGSSALGAFHYEPYDTKLARETRGATILQLSLYADLLADIQGLAPERFFVVTPGHDDGRNVPFGVYEYRISDYAAYFRLVRTRMLAAVAQGSHRLLAEHYPEPTDHCSVCRWWQRCDRQRRADDHLSFVVGAGRRQRVELGSQGVTTLAGAAAMAVPITFKPSRGSRETYARLIDQAQMQLRQRTERRPVFKALPVVENQGFCRLPAPSRGDLFLDLEGARFVREGGHDYLFGLGTVEDGQTLGYRAWWALDPAGEQRAFEDLIDRIVAARAVDPNLHVYHFAPYESTALKRLAGRYSTRQDALDDLLRAECFVDLYAIVRQAVRAGAESYSIKDLEQYYGYTREIPLREASVQRMVVEMCLESRQPDTIRDDSRECVERYNRDDVESTRWLRDWLERLRSEAIADGAEISRPVVEVREATATERTQAAEALRKTIVDGLDPAAQSPDHEGHHRWLLAYLIDWHHREEKAEWWEFFRLRDLPQDDLLDETKAVAGLDHLGEVEKVIGKNGRPTGSTIQRYRYPPQEIEISEGKTLRRQDEGTFGELVRLDRHARTIDVKRGRASGGDHPPAAFELDVINTKSVQEAVMRFAARLHAAGYREESAGADLLSRRPPRVPRGAFARRERESARDFAVRIVNDLDRTTLAIQGPPGAGKTFVGAHMIRAAVAAGKRVGVTATSHKVIQNLLDEVATQAANDGQTLRLGRKMSEDDATPSVLAFEKNDAALEAVRSGRIDVLGGTAWLWADENAAAAVDLLFVDEAGQFSLADALAVEGAAQSMVLLGDPQQLSKPQKASHPDGVDISALSHVLGESGTMPSDLGIFMADTYRLAPDICAFTSELFYDGKLQPYPSLINQRLENASGYTGAGLWWIPVEHSGNRSASDEEVDVVERLVRALLGGSWIDKDGRTRALTAADFRVVAPYNAQVNRLAARLDPLGVEVGTVDRFQGQTCAVVIYSMATSHPDDAPRGMEFLYSLNRLNVATSRGRCAVFVVANPAIVEPQCQTPRQMQLANALCRFVEMAKG